MVLSDRHREGERVTSKFKPNTTTTMILLILVVKFVFFFVFEVKDFWLIFFLCDEIERNRIGLLDFP
jgi:hypothetical protein